MADRHRLGNEASLALLKTLTARFSEDPLVESGTMFRSPGMKVGGKVFAFLGGGDRRGVCLREKPRLRVKLRETIG
ncbi:hypothetical protein [Arthrobacter sp. VKM Ac-2550]|uniref:hypothetical protein n=1 Tax=Crystallibacter permensis TaxID=1938888 RepID=UPI002225FA96|nr:hypothetical protein [Arthrobacter sp. VKM Ac-2550]MCW2132023.1 hypothetical protein [Arthrobacter sp. VKM Ac-2550]